MPRVRLFPVPTGSCISRVDTLYSTFYNVNRSYLRTCQIQLGDKARYSINTYTSADINSSNLFLQQKKMSFAVHSPMVINLASPDANIARRSIFSVNQILSIIDFFGNNSIGCVVHCGSIGSPEDFVRNFSLLSHQGTILIENSAGQGTQLGANFDDIEYYIQHIQHTNVGLCIDTQHAFAAGITRWQTPNEVYSILDRYHKIAPIRLIHLNDSATKFNSHVDQHAVLGQGYIWTDNLESLIAVMMWARLYSIPVIEETPNSEHSIELLRSLIKYY